MSITIEDVLTLKSTQNFTLVAGRGGVKNPVKMVDMLDFGWDREKEYSSLYGGGNLFDEDSFVLSSLMFASRDPEKLYKTIQRLIYCGVSGMAYKTVFYRVLPKEVLQLADDNDFAIFRIDDNVPYREVICDISDAISLNKNISASADYLTRMLYEPLSAEELAALAAKISNHFRGNAKVTIVIPKEEQRAFSIDAEVRRFQLYKEFKGKAVLCGFTADSQLGLALITTMDVVDDAKFDIITNNALSTLSLSSDAVRIGHSNIHPTFVALNQCVIEAYDAILAGRIMDQPHMHYREIGTLSFLIPTVDNPNVRTYMQTYLSPIIANEESMNTAITFIRANGDFTRAAEKLCLHKNTLRYRINKIHNLLCPDLSYESFYETLAAAVKIYLIGQLHS